MIQLYISTTARLNPQILFVCAAECSHGHNDTCLYGPWRLVLVGYALLFL